MPVANTFGMKWQKNSQSPPAMSAAPTVVATPCITLAPGDTAEALWKMGHKWYASTTTDLASLTDHC